MRKRKVRKEQPGKDSRERTAGKGTDGKGKPGRNSRERTTGKEQPGKDSKMGKSTQHAMKYVLKDYLSSIDIKMIVCILAVEMGMYLFAAYKGLGSSYFPVILLLMVFTTAGCVYAFHAGADHYLLVIVLVLLNIGFVVQQIQAGDTSDVSGFLKKFLVAIVVSVVVSVGYRHFADMAADRKVIYLMMLLQDGITVFMILLALMGNRVGSISGQAAAISAGGLTLFEVIKFLYLFVAAGLLCTEDECARGYGFDAAEMLPYTGNASGFNRGWHDTSVLSNTENLQRCNRGEYDASMLPCIRGLHSFRLKKHMITGEQLLVIHTAFLSLAFLICNELGTLLVVFISGLIMLHLFGKNRKGILLLTLGSVSGFCGIWALCEKKLFPMLLQGTLHVPGVMEKLIRRFGTALHPETDIADAGYQGFQALQAITQGGLTGISSERYRISLPEASNDFLFANVVQTTGFLMGLVVIVFYFVLLKRGMDIAAKCESLYFRGVATSITVVLITEAIIHVAYNISMFPVTGIPLYFLSQGFTAIVTGMAMISVLLVISIGSGNHKF